MCLVSVSYKQHSKYKLILVANRDEFYERPTSDMHYWEDFPNVCAGRDLVGKGTWLGVTRDGKLATLTNYRDPSFKGKNKRTRGEIVTGFLNRELGPEKYAENLKKTSEEYKGYNLLYGDVDNLYYFNNIENRYEKLPEGFYGLSNAFLDTPWPKVESLKEKLKSCIEGTNDVCKDQLFAMLKDNKVASDSELPNTGVGIELERGLSPIFIDIDDYGTMCSTVILVTNDNEVEIHERVYHKGEYVKEISEYFKIK